MRPQQQNRRMRGRNNNGGGGGNNNNNNNNRKGPNPLTRNYESNGPDVKIRGSAQQIAEKYATLARDAQSSGDRVMAENYLQHAEHYNRIIAAAQAQMPIQNAQQNRDDFDDDGDEDRDDFDNAGNNNGSETPAPAANHGAGPQPVIEGTPAELALNQENGRDNVTATIMAATTTAATTMAAPSRPPPQWRLWPERPAWRLLARRAGWPARQTAQRGAGQAERAGRNGFADDRSARRAAVQPQPAPQFDNLSPAALAAQAELNEAAAESGAARRPQASAPSAHQCRPGRSVAMRPARMPASRPQGSRAANRPPSIDELIDN